LVWLALIVLMTLFSVRLSILLSFWYNGFYSAMQKLDAKAFWFMLLVFATAGDSVCTAGVAGLLPAPGLSHSLAGSG